MIRFWCWKKKKTKLSFKNAEAFGLLTGQLDSILLQYFAEKSIAFGEEVACVFSIGNCSEALSLK